MRKPVLIGGGLGLLLLALIAGGIWMAGRAPEPQVPVASPPVAAPRVAAPRQPGSAVAAASPSSSEANKERRRRLSEVRAELNALRAQGMRAPPEKLRALVDELEALSPPGIDPRYYQALRDMLVNSAKVQGLGDELQRIKGSGPLEMARKEEILAEMRTLGERISADASSLQTYVTLATPSVPATSAASASTTPGVKTP